MRSSTQAFQKYPYRKQQLESVTAIMGFLTQAEEGIRTSVLPKLFTESAAGNDSQNVRNRSDENLSIEETVRAIEEDESIPFLSRIEVSPQLLPTLYYSGLVDLFDDSFYGGGPTGLIGVSPGIFQVRWDRVEKEKKQSAEDEIIKQFRSFSDLESKRPKAVPVEIDITVETNRTDRIAESAGTTTHSAGESAGGMESVSSVETVTPLISFVYSNSSGIDVQSIALFEMTNAERERVILQVTERPPHPLAPSLISAFTFWMALHDMIQYVKTNSAHGHSATPKMAIDRGNHFGYMRFYVNEYPQRNWIAYMLRQLGFDSPLLSTSISL